MKEKSNGASMREERFRKVASRRTQEILNKLRLLGNCANKANYYYSPEQVRKIFVTLDRQLKEARSKFDGSSSDKKEFSLD